MLIPYVDRRGRRGGRFADTRTWTPIRNGECWRYAPRTTRTCGAVAYVVCAHTLRTRGAARRARARAHPLRVVSYGLAGPATELRSTAQPPPPCLVIRWQKLSSVTCASSSLSRRRRKQSIWPWSVSVASASALLEPSCPFTSCPVGLLSTATRKQTDASAGYTGVERVATRERARDVGRHYKGRRNRCARRYNSLRPWPAAPVGTWCSSSCRAPRPGWGGCLHASCSRGTPLRRSPV